MSGLWTSTRRTLEMIKFEHSVFALPFALLGALLAAGGWPPWPVLGWIVLAMVGARSAAMTFNRIVDRRVDAANPRTRGRALAAGTLSLPFAWSFFALSVAVFELAALRLNPLGLALSPAAAWIAVRGSLTPRILLLVAAVTLWVAGLALLYACQDIEFARSRGDLHSVPKQLGVARTLKLAQACHLAMMVLLAWLLLVSHLGVLAWVGLAAVAGLLIWEHSLLAPEDLSRMNAAFFAVNGYIGIVLLVFWGAAILIGSCVVC